MKKIFNSTQKNQSTKTSHGEIHFDGDGFAVVKDEVAEFLKGIPGFKEVSLSDEEQSQADSGCAECERLRKENEGLRIALAKLKEEIQASTEARQKAEDELQAKRDEEARLSNEEAERKSTEAKDIKSLEDECEKKGIKITGKRTKANLQRLLDEHAKTQLSVDAQPSVTG